MIIVSHTKFTRRVVSRALAACAAALVFSQVGAANAQEPALKEMSLGREDAPVTIIEYASMTCPHCAEVHMEVLPKLKSDYIDTGKVRFVYRDFPLDGFALRAAAIARCAGPERFFSFVDVIYRQQKVWSRAADPLKGLEQIARLGGMSADQVKACLENITVQNYVVESRVSGERQFKISGTPTFVINGKVHRGIETFEALKPIIDPLLSGKS